MAEIDKGEVTLSPTGEIFIDKVYVYTLTGSEFADVVVAPSTYRSGTAGDFYLHGGDDIVVTNTAQFYGGAGNDFMVLSPIIGDPMGYGIFNGQLSETATRVYEKPYGINPGVTGLGVGQDVLVVDSPFTAGLRFYAGGDSSANQDQFVFSKNALSARSDPGEGPIKIIFEDFGRSDQLILEGLSRSDVTIVPSSTTPGNFSVFTTSHQFDIRFQNFSGTYSVADVEASLNFYNKLPDNLSLKRVEDLINTFN